MSEVPFRATVNEEGQIEIPKRLKKQLGIQPEDTLTVSILLGSGDAPTEEELDKINEELRNEEESED